MANRRFQVYEYRQVLTRMRMGESDRQIAASGLMGRAKCARVREVAKERGWLDRSMPLPADAQLASVLVRPKAPAGAITPSQCEPFRELITQWAGDGVDATTIHAALERRHGFAGSYWAVQRFVRSLELKAPRATSPMDFAAGEAAQVDFGSGPKLVDRRTGEVISTHVFVMTLAWSRHKYVEIVLDQTVPTWLGAHTRAFKFFGGVPRKVIIDNAKCAITKACRYDPVVQRAYEEYAEGVGFVIAPCPPRTPQQKGRVERSVSFVKRSFLALGEFVDLADANRQAAEWVMRVGSREHGTTREQPLKRFAEIERHLLEALPDAWPEHAEYKLVKVHGDCHVQFEKRRYSVSYRLVRRELWLRASETSIQLYLDHELIAQHPRLSRPGERSTVTEHLPPEAVAWRMQDQQWCLEQAAHVGICTRAVVERLFDASAVDNLRAVQGIIAFRKSYGDARLEAACGRAIAFDNVRRRTIKTILHNGLDQLAVDAPEQRAIRGAYDGSGRFCRTISLLD